MKKKIFWLGVLSFLVLVVSIRSFSQFVLPLTVPIYGQDTYYYCGPASTQMIMMGYPDSSSRKCFTQDDIYAKIQSHKQDNGFYSDPDGIRDTLMELNPPPLGGHFAIFANADRNVVMHDTLYWMAVRNYPTAALINAGNHWVVVTGFQTDVDPRSGSATLQNIYINDPAPPDDPPHDNPCTPVVEGNEGGTIRYATGSSWFSNDWLNPNSFGTKWLNEYVAIVEPPKIKGKVTAAEEVSRGAVISEEKALALASQWVKERKLAEKKPFAFLRNTQPKGAYLVNEKLKGYYVIPYEFKESGLCPGAVLLNAYTGDFQEIGAFPKPLEYLSREDAFQIALCSVRKKPAESPGAELLFRYCEQTRSRYRPIWMITMKVGGATLVRYIDQLGLVFSQLTKPPYGGD